jgi:hypothetical protein
MIRLASSENESGLIVQRSAPHTVNPSQYGCRELQGASLKSSWPYAVASTSAKRGPAPGGGIVTDLPEDTASPFHMLDQMLDNRMEVWNAALSAATQRQLCA